MKTYSVIVCGIRVNGIKAESISNENGRLQFKRDYYTVIADFNSESVGGYWITEEDKVNETQVDPNIPVFEET